MIKPDKLLEFENLLKIARDDLIVEIVDIVPDEFIETETGGEDERIGDRVFGTHGGVREAFREFDWNVSRAMSALRVAVAS
jgi:hypothetical protein